MRTVAIQEEQKRCFAKPSAPSQDLIARLTALSHTCGDSEIKAWIAMHLANDIAATKRKRRPQTRGVKVTLGNGSLAILGEQYVKENGVEIEDSNA